MARVGRRPSLDGTGRPRADEIAPPLIGPAPRSRRWMDDARRRWPSPGQLVRGITSAAGRTAMHRSIQTKLHLREFWEPGR